MISNFRDIVVIINDQKFFTNSVSIDSSASLSPVYEEGQRHSFKYIQNNANINTVSFGYYLTGIDYLKTFLSKDDVIFSGKIANFSFNSGCLTDYSVKFEPNRPIEVSATLSVFDFFTGSIQNSPINQRIIPLNASEAYIYNYTSGETPLGDLESATYDYKAEVLPIYYQETGLYKSTIAPNRIFWGKKQIKMSILNDDPNQYLPVNGKTASIRIDARGSDGDVKESFFISGKVNRHSMSFQAGNPNLQTTEIIQNRIDSSPYITGFAPSISTAGQYVSLFGSNFSNITSIHIGEDEVVNYSRNSESLITFQVPSNANSGIIKINSFESTADSPSGLFLSYPSILVTDYSPITLTSGYSAIIYGSNFYKISDVKFNGVTSSFSVISDNTIEAVVPGNITNGPITVVSSSRNKSGQSPAGGDYFAYPIITGFSPRTGIPGTLVSISGNNFEDIKSVKVNNLNTSYTIVSPQLITFPTPTGNTWGPVTVTNIADQFVQTPYSFVPQVIVTGTSIKSGIAYTPYSISGINFQTGLLYEIYPSQYKVSFNGTITGFYIQNQNKLTGLIPPQAKTGPVYIYKSNGVATYSSTGNFIYIDDVPDILSVFPSGLISGDSVNINIVGENLKNLSRVYITGDSFSTSSGKIINIWKNGSFDAQTDVSRTLSTTMSSDFFGMAANMAHTYSYASSLTGNSMLTGQSIATGRYYLVAENVGGTGSSFGPITLSEMPRISHIDTTILQLSTPEQSTNTLLKAPIYSIDGNTGTYAGTSSMGQTGTLTFTFSNLCQIHRIKLTTYDQPYTDTGGNPRHLQISLGTGNIVNYSGTAQVSPYSTYISGYGLNTGTSSFRYEANFVRFRSSYKIAGVEQLMPLRLAEVEIFGIPKYV